MGSRLGAHAPSDPVLRLAAVVAAWGMTRFLVLAVTLARESVYPAQDNAFEMTYFEMWGPAFARGEGEVPLRDGPWEYPAGAVPLIALPSLLRGAPYSLVFVQSMVVVDLALLLLLVLWGFRRGSLAGAWFWVAAVPLLGPVVLGRFDVVPTLFAAGGVVAASTAAPFTAGALLATGAAVKLWPALLGPLLLALHRGALRAVAGGIAVTAVVLLALSRFGGLDQALSFLSYQRDRGLQIESVPALPLMLQRLSGRQDMPIFFGFGSWQVDGPGAQALLRIADLGLLAVACLVVVLTWRVRRRHLGAADVDRGQALVVLAVVLMTGLLLFDKVLSAQYPVWIAGLVALGLCWPESPLRAVVLPLGTALLLTQLVYPLTYQDLLAGQARPVYLLVARDLLLVAVFAQAAWSAWGLGSAAAGTASEDEVPVHVEDREQPQTAS